MEIVNNLLKTMREPNHTKFIYKLAKHIKIEYPCVTHLRPDKPGNCEFKKSSRKLVSEKNPEVQIDDCRYSSSQHW
jgi:hypothetical protein